ncbi:hypothetical protein [Streptomyces sp. NBC_00316]|uniref:hypothetical protein n=1 Tax=Streptomyces sp. NBC_00316 TaxID=2975710 RepID=UPI003246DD5D
MQGRARGGSDELTLACDLRYVGRESAVFGQPEVATGILPGWQHRTPASPGRPRPRPRSTPEQPGLRRRHRRTVGLDQRPPPRRTRRRRRRTGGPPRLLRQAGPPPATPTTSPPSAGPVSGYTPPASAFSPAPYTERARSSNPSPYQPAGRDSRSVGRSSARCSALRSGTLP